MKIQEKIHQDPVVLQLKGDPLGEQDAVILKGRISMLIQDGVRHVILDLDEVKHINSAGLGGFVGAMTTLRKVGGDLRLIRPNANLQKILAITRLSMIFSIHSSLEEATRSFKSP